MPCNSGFECPRLLKQDQNVGSDTAMDQEKRGVSPDEEEDVADDQVKMITQGNFRIPKRG